MSAFSDWSKTTRRGASYSYFEAEGDYVCKIVARGSRETRHDQPMFYVKFEIVEVLNGGNSIHKVGACKDWSRVLEKTPKGNLTDKGGYALKDLKSLTYAIGGGDPEFDGDKGLEFALDFFALDEKANSTADDNFDPAVPEDMQPVVIVKVRGNEVGDKVFYNLYFDPIKE